MDSRLGLGVCAASCLVSVLLAPLLAVAKDPAPYRDDRVIVKMREGIPAAQLLFTPAGAAAKKIVKPAPSAPESGVRVLDIDPSTANVDEVIDALNASGLVEYAEPDYWLYALAVPTDPLFEDLWGFDQGNDVDIDAPEAWDITEGDAGVVVAIVDTGISYNHPDLAQNMWVNPGETPGNGVDDDGNGYIDDVHGIDCINGSGNPTDSGRHGTHVAGTIGAVAHNSFGVVGVSPNVQLMALKFLGASGGTTSDAIECLTYAAMMKTTYGINIKATNNSWGGGGFSQGLADAIRTLDAADVLFIAAAGNSTLNNDASPSYPATYDVDNVISVAAIGIDGQLAAFSNYGATTVDLAAPGVDVLSTVPGGFGRLSGTSMAAPHVTGAAALVAAHLPAAGSDQIKAILLDLADPAPELAGKVATGGRLNAASALCSPGDVALNVSPNADFRLGLYHDITLRAWLRDCGVPMTSATLSAVTDTGDLVFLRDDGVFPDETAADGQYTGSWKPVQSGPVVLTTTAVFPTGASMGVAVSGDVVETTKYAVDDTTPFEWIDATRGSRLPVNRDDSFANTQIGFAFPFYGETHTKVRISSNGYLTFGGNAKEYANRAIPSEDGPGALIAPYWDDLHPYNTGRVYRLLEGSEPDRRTTFQWTDFGYYGASGRITFQVTLYELDGRIAFRYQDISGGTAGRDLGASATVGVQDGRGEFGEQYSFARPLLSDASAVDVTPDFSDAPPKIVGVRGSRISLRDRQDRPDRRVLSARASGDAITAPDLGTPGDPTRWGGILRVESPSTGESMDIALPASGWTHRANSYRFRDDTCAVRITKKRWTARCRGSALTYSLSEPQQGAMAARLDLGSNTAYCTMFGQGSVDKDYGYGFGGGRGLGAFRAASAPAPAGCP